MRKKMLSLSLAMVMGMMLTGCGNKSPLDPKKPVTIEVWNYYNGDQLAALKGEVGAAEAPNIFMAYADTAYTADQMGGIVDLKGYLTEAEISAYIDSYMDEGDFSGNGEIKIFPIAKSTEVLVLNKTDWDEFAAQTGATYEDLADMEGLVKTAQL